jgi:hypothetical protein
MNMARNVRYGGQRCDFVFGPILMHGRFFFFHSLNISYEIGTKIAYEHPNLAAGLSQWRRHRRYSYKLTNSEMSWHKRRRVW